MSPCHFLQLSRSILAVRNNRKNEEMVRKVKKTFNISEIELSPAGKLRLPLAGHTKAKVPCIASNVNCRVTTQPSSLQPSDAMDNHNSTSCSGSSPSVANKLVHSFTDHMKNVIWKTKLNKAEHVLWDSLWDSFVLW